MSEFAVHTIVHRDGSPVSFVPGDEVPEWAENLVGDHVLTEPREAPEPDKAGSDAADETPDEGAADEDPDETETPAAEPVDFTGTKPRASRRR